MSIVNKIATVAAAATMAVVANSNDVDAQNLPQPGPNKPSGHTKPLPNPGPNNPSQPPVYNNNNHQTQQQQQHQQQQQNAYGGQGGKGGQGGNATGGNASSSSNSNANGGNASNGGVNINNPVATPIGNAPAVFTYADGRCKWGFGVSAGFPYGALGVSMAFPDKTCMDTENALEGLRLTYANGDTAGAAVFYADLKRLRPDFALALNAVAASVMQCPALVSKGVSPIFGAADPYVIASNGGCAAITSISIPPTPQVIERVRTVYRDRPAPVQTGGCPAPVTNITVNCDGKKAPAPAAPAVQ